MLSNSKNQIFQYNGSPITFQIGGTLMVNATEMAKPFGKTTKDWLRTKQSKEYISSLSTVRQISLTELVIVNQGNFSSKEQGTWMHEDVALEFARWLSPAFAIWCNDRIKELLLNGSTSINQETNNLNQELLEANGKINHLTARLDACQMELNYLKGRMEVEKELAETKARMEVMEELIETKTYLRMAAMGSRIEVKDGKILIPSAMNANSTETQQRKQEAEKPKEHRETPKRTTEIPKQSELFTSISLPDYEWSCKLGSKKEVEKNYPEAMLVGKMSVRLKSEHGLYIKPGDIFVWLRKNGFLSSDRNEYNKPSAECMRNRWIVYRRQRGINERGFVYCTPYITAEGYLHFSRLILQSCNKGDVR